MTAEGNAELDPVCLHECRWQLQDCRLIEGLDLHLQQADQQSRLAFQGQLRDMTTESLPTDMVTHVEQCTVSVKQPHTYVNSMSRLSWHIKFSSLIFLICPDVPSPGAGCNTCSDWHIVSIKRSLHDSTEAAMLDGMKTLCCKFLLRLN